MKKLELDVHTHTIVSGHAYGTITEMAKAAAEAGLQILGITEHAKGIPGTCEDIYFMNLGVLPRRMFGIELMFGSEINILDYEGALSLDKQCIDKLDIRIAGIHDTCYRFGSIVENTSAVLNAMKNPDIDIISHPDDGRCPLDYEKLVKASREYHTLLEINNNSLRSKKRKNTAANTLTILNLCKQQRVPVLLSSDAHYMTDIGNTDQIAPLIEEAGFPLELVINYEPDAFREFLAQNRKNG